MMREEVFYGLMVFAMGCIFMWLFLPLFLNLCRKAEINVLRFRLSGIPLELSIILSLLVVSILFPTLFALIEIPLELLAGWMMVFLLGVACDVGSVNNRLCLFVLIFASLAFPLSGFSIKGTWGAIFTIFFVVAFSLTASFIEKHLGYGALFLISFFSFRYDTMRVFIGFSCFEEILSFDG